MNKLPLLATLQRPRVHAVAQGYHAHHFSCPVCIAAGLGIGDRCHTGQALWMRYISEHDAVAAPTHTQEAA